MDTAASEEIAETEQVSLEMDSNKVTYTCVDAPGGDTVGTEGEGTRQDPDESPKSPLLYLDEEDTDDKEKEKELSSSLETSTYLESPGVVGGHLCPGFVRRFAAAYRSTNPQSRVTPFAVVLLLVLLLIYVLNQADRLVLAVLIPAGLRCSGSNSSENAVCNITSSDEVNTPNFTDCIEFDDNQQGLLTGPAFTIIYVVAGLPLAYIADTRSRPLVLLIGITFWSVTVLLTGFAQKFWELLTLRILLGVGEASYNPVAYSLLADFYPSKYRAIALSVYHYGVYIGGSFGWMSGNITVALDWRWTFRILGFLGLATLPLAMLALWEPKKIRERRKKRIKGKKVYSVWEVFKFLLCSPPYWLLLVASSVRNIPGYALGAWLPTFYTRVFQLQSDDYGTKVGLAVLFGGGFGCFLGGLLSDLVSKYYKGGKAYVIAASQLLAAPCIIGVLLASTPSQSYGLMVLAYVTAETWLGPAAAIVQDICMPAMRAQASAVYIGVITIVASIGPVLVPALFHLDYLAGCDGIKYSLLFIVPALYILSSILFVILGVVMNCWTKRQAARQGSYSTFTDSPVPESDKSTSPSNEW